MTSAVHFTAFQYAHSSKDIFPRRNINITQKINLSNIFQKYFYSKLYQQTIVNPLTINILQLFINNDNHY